MVKTEVKSIGNEIVAGTKSAGKAVDGAVSDALQAG